jgi:hypothetical protein
MYGFNSLKPTQFLNDDEVECPVIDCTTMVQRQRKEFKRDLQFKCPLHQIYISPSTFEYENDTDNILWSDVADALLIKDIKTVKRESRIARENSEDAVTFNVFRYLQRNELLDSLMSEIYKERVINSELILWSYSEKEKRQYSLLNEARDEFGETISRGSEPDVIIQTDKVLFFIEAKVTAPNKTKPRKPSETKKYLTGGDNWFNKVFKHEYESIAVEQQKYELLRFWLLGTWMANKIGVKFSLISLVLGDRDIGLDVTFKKMINEDCDKQFNRMTWEDIYEFILKNNINSHDYPIITDYYKNKCLGYANNTLIKAFSI